MWPRAAPACRRASACRRHAHFQWRGRGSARLRPRSRAAGWARGSWRAARSGRGCCSWSAGASWWQPAGWPTWPSSRAPRDSPPGGRGRPPTAAAAAAARRPPATTTATRAGPRGPAGRRRLRIGWAPGRRPTSRRTCCPPRATGAPRWAPSRPRRARSQSGRPCEWWNFFKIGVVFGAG